MLVRTKINRYDSRSTDAMAVDSEGEAVTLHVAVSKNSASQDKHNETARLDAENEAEADDEVASEAEGRGKSRNR